MIKDAHKTYIRFVVFKGEILAVFMRTSAQRRLYIPSWYSDKGAMRGKPQWLRASYARVGQHCECYDGMYKRKRATPEQYAPLQRELEGMGYNLHIC